jgi:chromosome partitioning protein
LAERLTYGEHLVYKLVQRKKGLNMRIITFCSFKGGTAKTSTALNLGACLAKNHKKKVLLVDFDSQANLSIGLGIGPDSEETLVPVLQGTRKIQEVIQQTNIPDLFIVAANAYLDGIEKTQPLVGDPYAHERLRHALKSLGEIFDYCLVDTPPSLGWLTQSAFLAAHYNMICAIPEAYSVIGLRRLKEFQDSIQRYHSIDVLGVVLSLWDERGASNKTFLDEINGSFPNKLLKTRVRRDVSVSRAVLQGRAVIEYAPECRASGDYCSLTEEVLQLLEPSPARGKLEKLIKTTKKVTV